MKATTPSAPAPTGGTGTPDHVLAPRRRTWASRAGREHARGGQYALLTDGGTVEVRPARAQDFEAVRAMHAAMSPDNMYLRFFSMSPGAAEWEARRVCREPDSDHAALLAWQDGRLVGVGAYELPGSPAWRRSRSPSPMTCTAAVSPACCSSTWSGWRGSTTWRRSPGDAGGELGDAAGIRGRRPAREAADSRGRGRADLPAARRRRRLPAGPLPGGRGEPGKPGGCGEPAPAAGPRSVAVVGASRRRATVGRAILHNIVTSGFTGPVYAVNPRAPAMEWRDALRGIGR